MCRSRLCAELVRADLPMCGTPYVLSPLCAEPSIVLSPLCAEPTMYWVHYVLGLLCLRYFKELLLPDQNWLRFGICDQNAVSDADNLFGSLTLFLMPLS